MTDSFHSIPPRKASAHALYKAPPTDPVSSRCISLQIPDSQEWFDNLFAALSSLTTWLNYSRSGTTRETDVAHQWLSIIQAAQFCPEPEVNMVILGTIEVGAVVAYPTKLSPDTGWLWLDGQNVSREEYPELCAYFDQGVANESALWQAISEPFDGYVLPDMWSLPYTVVNAGLYTPGDYGGAMAVTLTNETMPAHQHDLWYDSVTPVMSAGGSTGDVGRIRATGGYSASHKTSSAGEGEPHQNMPPYMPLWWHILAKPVPMTILDDLDERYVKNVYAIDCQLWQQRIADEFIVDIAQCARDAIGERPWDEPTEENTPGVLPVDCVWGAIDALVEAMVAWAKDFLDLIENALDLANDLLEWMPTKFPSMVKYAPALEILSIVTYAGQIGIIAARADLTNQALIDDWKCVLFCAVHANGDVLTVPIWVDWLNYLSPLIPPYTTMGGLAMHVLAYAMGTDYLFKRYILYSDRCNDDWQVLCGCGGAPTCTPLDITWADTGATPSTWEGQRKPTGNPNWLPLTREDNTFWHYAADWDTIAVEYTPAAVCDMAEFTVYAERLTNNQLTVRLYLYNQSDELVEYDSHFYPINSTPPASWTITNNSGQPIARMRAEVGSKRVRITRNKVVI